MVLAFARTTSKLWEQYVSAQRSDAVRITKDWVVRTSRWPIR